MYSQISDALELPLLTCPQIDITLERMKRDKAKQKALLAIRTIVEAAKELAKAEQAYYERKPHKPRRGGPTDDR
jgi:hypothetical protein